MNDAIQAATDLAALVEQYQDEIDPTVQRGWSVQNLGSLEFALQRIAEKKADAAEVLAVAEEAKRRIDGRAEKLCATLDSGVSFFTERVLDYMARARPLILRGKAKSRACLYGRVGWRARGGRLVVTDDDAALAWASTLSETEQAPLVRVKREVSKSGFQALFERTGEIPPGCEVEPMKDEPFVDAEIPGAITPANK